MKNRENTPFLGGKLSFSCLAKQKDKQKIKQLKYSRFKGQVDPSETTKQKVLMKERFLIYYFAFVRESTIQESNRNKKENKDGRKKKRTKRERLSKEKGETQTINSRKHRLHKIGLSYSRN